MVKRTKRGLFTDSKRPLLIKEECAQITCYNDPTTWWFSNGKPDKLRKDGGFGGGQHSCIIGCCDECLKEWGMSGKQISREEVEVYKIMVDDIRVYKKRTEYDW